jgi:hypothetical protein
MNKKVPRISKRQSVLLDRLVAFCERCGSLDLPLRITRIYGYGSFFRRKDRPADVDLTVLCGERHPLFERFVKLVEDDLDESCPALPPNERMRRLADCHPEPEIQDASPMFSSWLEGVSDHMLFGQQTILGQTNKLSAHFYTQRLLHLSLPGIRGKLTSFNASHSAKVVHEIWSPEQTDVRAAVGRIWARDQRDDLLTEARWFEEQARPYLLQIAVLQRITDRLLRSRIKVVEGEVWGHFDAWLKRADLGFPADLCVKATNRVLGDFGRDVLPDPPDYDPPDFESLDTDGLAAVVEDKRQGLIRLRERVVVLRLATKYLAYWAFFDKKQPVGVGRERYLIEKVMESISKGEIKPVVVQEILFAELQRSGLR